MRAIRPDRQYKQAYRDARSQIIDRLQDRSRDMSISADDRFFAEALADQMMGHIKKDKTGMLARICNLFIP